MSIKPSNYNSLSPFKAWVQQALPAIYDDSLSYTDLLARMLKYINELVENNNALTSDMKNAIDYINNYFNSTDFTEKVNTKLDAMVQDGSLSALIQPLFDAYKKDIDSEVSSQNTKINNIQTEQTVLSNRMDTFTQLPSGSTSGDAELEDIRIAYNGLKYSSAGTSVRTQIENINKQFIYGYNLLSLENIENNKYIDETGKISNYEGWSLSDYLEIQPNSTYRWKVSPSASKFVTNVYYGIYDVNKNYLGKGSTGDGTNTPNITIGGTGRYIRVSQKTDYFAKTAMLCEQSVFDTLNYFIPYDYKLNFNEFYKYVNSATQDEYTVNVYNNVMKSIQRIGAGMNPYPKHSLDAFKLAYKKGFRTLLCDLEFTSDNIGVCNHDQYINQYYNEVYDSSGTLVPKDPPIYFKENTYNQLNLYNYGKMGYHLLKFEDMVKLAKKLGVELYVEVKEMTEEQSKIACDIIRKYGMNNKTSWSGSSSQMAYVISNIENARVSLSFMDLTESNLQKLNALKTGKNKVFWFGWDTSKLTDDIVSKLIDNDIEFEFGSINTEDGILEYFKQGTPYYYCTGIESNTVIAGKVILDNTLK